MGGKDKKETTGEETVSEEVTEDQLAGLAEDEGTTDETAEAVVEEEAAVTPGLSEEQVETVVRKTLQYARSAAPQQAPAGEGAEDDAEMPVTRGEMATLQRNMAANQQAMQLRAELGAAEAQFASEHDDEDKEDFYASAIRSLQANPNQSAAAAYKATVKRHEKSVDKGVGRRIDKAAKKKAARGEPMGPGSGAPTKAPALPEIDYNDSEAVSKLGKKIILEIKDE
jgi:hypothetical protein